MRPYDATCHNGPGPILRRRPGVFIFLGNVPPGVAGLEALEVRGPPGEWRCLVLHVSLEAAGHQHDVPTVQHHGRPHLSIQDAFHRHVFFFCLKLLPDVPLTIRHDAQKAGIEQRYGGDISRRFLPIPQQFARIVVPGNRLFFERIMVDDDKVEHVRAELVTEAYCAPKVRYASQGLCDILRLLARYATVSEKWVLGGGLVFILANTPTLHSLPCFVEFFFLAPHQRLIAA